MPKNNLSRRFDQALADRNNNWDKLFCKMFWSPFEVDARRYRTRGCYVPVAEESSSEETEEAPESNNSSNEWVELNHGMAHLGVRVEAIAEPYPVKLTVAAHRAESPPTREDSAKENLQTVDLPYKCEKCSKRFRLPRSLRNHWITHSTERLFACSCGKSFKNCSSLGIHRRNMGHHNWTVHCPQCGKPFAKASHMGRHSIGACSKYLSEQQHKLLRNGSGRGILSSTI